MIDLICDFDRPSDKQKLYEILKTRKGKQVIQMKQYRKGRSLPQNSFLWGVVYRYVASETGYTTEEAHELFKRRFWNYEKNGETFTKSTTDMTTEEMETYIEKIRQFCLENLDLYIPTPNETIY